MFEVGDRVHFDKDSTLYRALMHEHKAQHGTVREIIDDKNVLVQWDGIPLSWRYRKSNLKHVDEPFVFRLIRRKVAQYRMKR